jgi:hypothetical protein
VSEPETGAAGTDTPALPHDPNIPALAETGRPGIDDVFAEAGLGRATAGSRATIALAEGDGGLGSGSGPLTASG